MRISRRSVQRLGHLAMLLVCLTVAFGANAGVETEDEIRAKRDYWQQKYRALRTNKASHLENAARMKYAHEQSQLSNYPRGGARERLLLQWKAYLRKAEEVQHELDAIWDEARAAEVPPGWLYEVEDEPIVLKDVPAATAAKDVEEDDGRNPLYRDRGAD